MKINQKWVRRIPSEFGNYVDAAGTRYTVEWCHKLLTPDGSTEADHGYELHASVESACEAWGLAPYVDPTGYEEFRSIEAAREYYGLPEEPLTNN